MTRASALPSIRLKHRLGKIRQNGLNARGYANTASRLMTRMVHPDEEGNGWVDYGGQKAEEVLSDIPEELNWDGVEADPWGSIEYSERLYAQQTTKEGSRQQDGALAAGNDEVEGSEEEGSG